MAGLTYGWFFLVNRVPFSQPQTHTQCLPITMCMHVTASHTFNDWWTLIPLLWPKCRSPGRGPSIRKVRPAVKYNTIDIQDQEATRYDQNRRNKKKGAWFHSTVECWIVKGGFERLTSRWVCACIVYSLDATEYNRSSPENAVLLRDDQKCYPRVLNSGNHTVYSMVSMYIRWVMISWTGARVQV